MVLGTRDARRPTRRYGYFERILLAGSYLLSCKVVEWHSGRGPSRADGIIDPRRVEGQNGKTGVWKVSRLRAEPSRNEQGRAERRAGAVTRNHECFTVLPAARHAHKYPAGRMLELLETRRVSCSCYRATSGASGRHRQPGNQPIKTARPHPPSGAEQRAILSSARSAHRASECNARRFQSRFYPAPKTPKSH